MRKILLIACLIPGLLILAYAYYSSKQPTDTMKQVLGRYISYQNNQAHDTWSIQRMVRARLPWNFSPLPGDLSYGDSNFFHTDVHTLTQVPVVQATGDLSTDHGDSGVPLPNPPVDIWCILLERENPLPVSLENLRVVYAARYDALYAADWVILESAPFRTLNEINQRNTQIGCNIGNLPSLITRTRSQPRAASAPGPAGIPPGCHPGR